MRPETGHAGYHTVTRCSERVYSSIPFLPSIATLPVQPRLVADLRGRVDPEPASFLWTNRSCTHCRNFPRAAVPVSQLGSMDIQWIQDALKPLSKSPLPHDD